MPDADQYPSDMLNGDWTYRSFLNNPTPVMAQPDMEAARNALWSLLFAEAKFSFAVTGVALTGVIDWGSGGLDLTGTLDTTGSRLSTRIVGMGRPGSPTDGWRYDYDAVMAEKWANGVNQVPSLTGTVIRVNPHGGALAGVVASFYAAKRG